MNLIKLALLLWPLISVAAPSKENYTATAHDSSSNSVYQEKHEISFTKDGKVFEAKTDYMKPNGEMIGALDSNFEKQITAPEHTYKDLRDGSSYGLEIKDDQYILWHQDKGKPRQEKAFKQSDFPADSLVVGCQGLHYYLVDHLDTIKEKKTIPIKYLIPGKLDYYSFTLNLKNEDENYLYLSLHIDNFFLRLFTDELNLKYRKKDRRLVSYSGLSNIANDKGKIQFVNIDYVYGDL